MEQKFFRGTFQIKVDDKGRISLPSSFRYTEEIANKNYVFTNSMYEGRACLDLYPYEAWVNLENRIASLPPLKKEVQSFQRFYLAAAQPVEADSQTRILIPKSLRDYAKIEGDAVLVGMGTKIEIWSQFLWDQVVAKLSEQFESNLQLLSEIEGVA